MTRRMLGRVAAAGSVLVTMVTGLALGGGPAGAADDPCPPHCIEATLYVMQHEVPPYHLAWARVWLWEVAPRDITFIANTVDGTATARADYEPLRERPVTIPAGERFVDIPLQAVPDGRPEPTEHYWMVISFPSYGVIVNDRTLVTIMDGQPPRSG